jgi:FkbM family methyltransferase
MYTQNNEEQLILDYFKSSNPQELTVLDVGANDGITFSNSKKIIELGWNAVLIEPSPKAFERLQKLHESNEKVKILNVAITPTNSIFCLHESESLLNMGDVALVSSIKHEETERWRKANINFNKVDVPGITFDNMCMQVEEYTYDLISIDVEGFDYDVLSQIDLNKVGCKMLIVEFNGKDKHNFVHYVSEFGLKLISENPENLIFTR